MTSSARARSLSGIVRPSVLASLEVDDQFELVHLFDRQVGWHRSFENSTDVNDALVIAIAEDRS
jgi:hypothetical protein